MSNPSPQGLAALCSLLFCLLVPPALADSLLNGLAAHSELNQQQFIGGLYTNTLSSDPNEILNSPGSKRLELHVVARRLSSRRLNSMWIEGMAINNPPGLLSAQAENMVAFTNLINRTLREGDVLAIRGANNTTTVTLNGVTLGSIESADLFPMILRTWIGAVPLSSDFRDGLLSSGQVDSALRAQYESLQPSEARRQAIARWLEPDEEDPAAATATADAETDTGPAALDSRPDRPMISAPILLAQPAAEVESPATETAEAAEPAATETDPPADTQPREEPAPVQSQTAARASAQQQQASLASAAEREEEELLAEEEELDEIESGPALTAESLLSRQLYHSSLLRWTYQNIRYPGRAADRGQEGSIRIAVVIDRQGKVLSTSEVEMSRHSLLNREALRAIERSNPFPAIPDGIPGDEFSFSLPIQFKLPD